MPFWLDTIHNGIHFANSSTHGFSLEIIGPRAWCCLMSYVCTLYSHLQYIVRNMHMVHTLLCFVMVWYHDDVIKWKNFSRYWPFVRSRYWPFHLSPLNSLHKGQWRGALMFSLICTWINSCINNGDADDLRRNCTHYDVIVLQGLFH